MFSKFLLTGLKRFGHSDYLKQTKAYLYNVFKLKVVLMLESYALMHRIPAFVLKYPQYCTF